MAANSSAMGEWTHIPEQDHEELTLETEMTYVAIRVQRLALRYQMTRVQMLEHLSEAILGGPVKIGPWAHAEEERVALGRGLGPPEELEGLHLHAEVEGGRESGRAKGR